MNTHRPRGNVSRFDAKSGEHLGERAGGPRQLPAWDRETLTRQIQGIDGSTRGEAELQVDTFERTFRDALSAPPPESDAHR